MSSKTGRNWCDLYYPKYSRKSNLVSKDFLLLFKKPMTHTYYVLVVEDTKSNKVNPCLTRTQRNRSRNDKLHTGWKYHLWAKSAGSESPSRQRNRKADWWEWNKILASQKIELRCRTGLHFPERTEELKKNLKQKFSGMDPANILGSREELEFNDHFGTQTCLHQHLAFGNKTDFGSGDF